jgi:hypothetical protein
MCIVDQSGILSPEDLDELDNFIQNHLLSQVRDRVWLGKILVHNIQSNYDGTWGITVKQSPEGVLTLVAVITLNIYRFRGLASHIRLIELKKVLAHEYGHHWTLVYLYASQRMTDYFYERLPAEYYALRDLSQDHYACDYSLEWHRCDKEIIAEDYRVLFAPHPCDQNHRMVEHPVLQLESPNQAVADYIQSLGNLV